MKKLNNKVIQNDIMLYKKNKLSGNLALLGLVFECLYFMIVFAQVANNIQAQFVDGKMVYTFLNGISVILNLVILLVVFLASEEIKGYNKKFCYVIWVVAAVQIIRIFGYPLTTFSTRIKVGIAGSAYIFNEGTFIALIAFLVASAACLIASGVIGYIRILRLEKYKRDLESGEVDLKAALAEEDTPSAQAEQIVADTEVE